MWEFIRDHPLYPRIVRILQDTGFSWIIEIDRLQIDWALITAMIERWRPETHTFHLPIGEATITLEDVEVLFGLPVDGILVAYPHAPRDYRGVHYQHILQRLIDFQSAEETALSGASRLQMTPARQHLAAMDAEIMDDSPAEDIDWHTRLLLLLMFGGVMFPNTSGNLVSLRFLHHLERLDDLPSYSWGATVLGYLFGHGSGSCSSSHLYHPMAPDAPPPPFLPFAWRWVDRRGYVREFETRHHLPYYRDLLDLLEGAQFVWSPYSDALIAGLTDYCSRDRAMWSSSIPLICLDIDEHHATDRVLCQFGRPQLVPIPPTWLRTHYHRDDRPGLTRHIWPG
uniref:Serine/threonine-protein phosphatase 7 long form homolog n=1 Tax=Nicotiana tabacum TaxID=4097 RepID=A0A1S4AFV2_TOBAC|nr:PREDICTED: serine/threonine-protein phosphatase 7 long form homolog [Nicotiana tabacum]